MWLLQPKGLPGNMTIADLPIGDNTLVVPWASVNDILGHRATRAFVSHCGARGRGHRTGSGELS